MFFAQHVGGQYTRSPPVSPTPAPSSQGQLWKIILIILGLVILLVCCCASIWYCCNRCCKKDSESIVRRKSDRRLLDFDNNSGIGGGEAYRSPRYRPPSSDTPLRLRHNPLDSAATTQQKVAEPASRSPVTVTIRERPWGSFHSTTTNNEALPILTSKPLVYKIPIQVTESTHLHEWSIDKIYPGLLTRSFHIRGPIPPDNDEMRYTLDEEILEQYKKPYPWMLNWSTGREVLEAFAAKKSPDTKVSKIINEKICESTIKDLIGCRCFVFDGGQPGVKFYGIEQIQCEFKTNHGVEYISFITHPQREWEMSDHSFNKDAWPFRY